MLGHALDSPAKIDDISPLKELNLLQVTMTLRYAIYIV